MPLQVYGSRAMIWKEKESCKTMIEQMGNPRGLMGRRGTDAIPNGRAGELLGVKKWKNERIDESVLPWLGI